MATTKKIKQPFVIARGKDSGVHAGYLVDDGAKSGWVELKNSRRIWYWSGAATLDQIAVYGLNPAVSGTSKIAAKITQKRMRFGDTCELITCSPAGEKCIVEFAEWKI